MVVAVLCGLVALQAISRMAFLHASGWIGQRMLLELGAAGCSVISAVWTSRSMTATPPVGWSAGRPTMSKPSGKCSKAADSLVTAVLTLVGTAVLLWSPTSGWA